MGRKAWGGRPVNTRTKLGAIIAYHNIPTYVVGGKCGIHPRKLTEYLAGREPIANYHLPYLCQFFNCTPQDLVGLADDRFEESIGRITHVSRLTPPAHKPIQVDKIKMPVRGGPVKISVPSPANGATVDTPPELVESVNSDCSPGFSHTDGVIF